MNLCLIPRTSRICRYELLLTHIGELQTLNNLVTFKLYTERKRKIKIFYKFIYIYMIFCLFTINTENSILLTGRIGSSRVNCVHKNTNLHRNWKSSCKKQTNFLPLFFPSIDIYIFHAFRIKKEGTFLWIFIKTRRS